MTGKEIANILIKNLVNMNFIVHRYNAYSTSSIYLKLDYGLSCGIRISDHPGIKKYKYRFNVLKDYKGNEVILKDGLICHFYNFNELPKLLQDVEKERTEKLKKYGIEKYKLYMKEQSKTDLYKRFKKVKGDNKNYGRNRKN